MSVYDPRFRTREGVGVGSTLGELRSHYAVNLLTELGLAGHVPSLELSFQLEGTAPTNDRTRIASVWVIPQVAAVRERRCPDWKPF